MVDVKDLKVKLMLDDAEGQAVVAELLRGAAALEDLFWGIGKVLSSEAGQAVIVDALASRITELKAQLDHECRRSEQLRQNGLAYRRALALQFEEGDLVEVLCEQFDQVIKAGSIVKVETTPVQRGVNGQPLWGEGDWAPTTLMCSHPERVGNLEIPILHLRLVKKGGVR